MPRVAIAYAAAVFKHGLDANPDRAPYNWRATPIKLSVYLSALHRHLDCVIDGEWEDPKSKLPHLASVITNAAIIIDAKLCGTLINDLPKESGKASQVHAELQTSFEQGAPMAAPSTPKGIYDPASRQWVEHPAQLMAIEAFKKEQAPVAEQWGVFYRHPITNTVVRSVEVPGSYTKTGAIYAAADYCNDMGSTQWFAQKL